LPKLKNTGLLGILDAPKLKQLNPKKPHHKRYGFNLWK